MHQYSVQYAATCSRWFLARGFLPRRWRRYIPPKRLFTQDLHDATSQNTAFFIVTAVKTSDLTNLIFNYIEIWSLRYSQKNERTEKENNKSEHTHHPSWIFR
jgi:hypothetical protein